MNSITDPRTVVADFEQAKTKFEDFFTPYVKAWIEIEVSLGNLSKIEAQQEFVYEQTEAHGIRFTSESWEETWQYGGYEHHSGNEILIPFEFFEDAQTFKDEAEVKKAAIKRIEETREKARRAEALKNAENQLARAKAAFEAVK